MNTTQNITAMTLSEIYGETCKLVKEITTLKKQQKPVSGQLQQQLAKLRAEHDRRTCLPMIV